jgi:phosphatidylserine/phosphatidylglycerophosphate/cardiolipin synthase-like enzyme
MVRTIPPETYHFAPNGIATIFDAYVRAIRSAQRFIYIENQYLWREVFRGLDSLAWGGKDPRMQQILDELADALRRGVRIAIVLPDHPNCGRRFTDDAVTWLREQALYIGAPDRLHVFTAGNAAGTGPHMGDIIYRPIYTHGKVMIVDDKWWTAGSANLNSRGMHSDAELNITVSDERSARELRLALWGEHTQDVRDVDLSRSDPLAGLDLLIRLAEENREHVMRKEYVNGHLLPYMTEADGRNLGLPVHAEHGWLDSLDTGAGALPEHRQGRYI